MNAKAFLLILAVGLGACAPRPEQSAPVQAKEVPAEDHIESVPGDGEPGQGWFAMSIQRFTARLEAEPELLIELCTASKGTPGYEAVYRFVRTPEGKERLLEAYLEAVFASGLDLTSRLHQVRTYKDGAWLLPWLYGNDMKQMSYWDRPNWAFQGAGSGWSVEHRIHRGQLLPAVLSELQLLVFDVGYDRYPFPEDDELTFSVVKHRQGEDGILGSGVPWDGWTEGRVALVESVRHQWPRDER